MGQQARTQLLYVFEEQQLYGKQYEIPNSCNVQYRCVNRKCLSRIIRKSENECVKLVDAKPHNHKDSCEQKFINLKAK